MAKIIINDGEKILETATGTTLVAALAEHKLVLPSACGGHGRCGLCRVRVLHGGSPLTEFETKKFHAEQLANQWRLACQVQIDGDIEIALPGQLIGAPIYECTVEQLTDLTYDIKGVRLKLPALPANAAWPFKPGQYMQVTVPPYNNIRQSAYRAYSLASPPTEKNFIEFCIRRIPNGVVTTYIFDYLKVGDKLSLTGPYGDFYLRDGERELIFIAGSSGLSPIRSMMYDLIARKITRQTTLFFGGCTARDLFYVEQFRQWEREHSWFKYVPTLNEADDTINCAHGLVTEVVEKQAGDLANAEAYLCGSPGMLNACSEVLRRKNMPESQIFYDKFA